MRGLFRGRPGSHGFVRTYLPVILLLTALTTLAAVASAVIRPTSYLSTSQVVVYPDPSRGTAAGEPDMGTQRTVASSGVVTNAAAKKLGISAGDAIDGLSVTVPVDTNVLEFRYAAPTAAEARKRVAAFTSSYVAYRNGKSKVRLAEVITQPVTPNLPTRPNLPLVIGLGLVLGALIGSAFAFVWDRVRGRMRDHGDVTRTTGLPVLVDVPKVAQSSPLRPDEAADELDEAFAYLAAQLTTLPVHGRGASFVITSPSRGAGTTTVAARLAIALAGAGKEVVLIGADLRRPTVHKLFETDEWPGLTDVLAVPSGLDRALAETSYDGLSLLPAGRPPTGPTQWLNVDDLEALIADLCASRLVVIDTPAVNGAAETTLLAGRTDFVVLVMDARERRSSASDAVATLKSAGGNPIGWVLNRPPTTWWPRRALAGLRGAEPDPAPRIAPVPNTSESTSGKAGRGPESVANM